MAYWHRMADKRSRLDDGAGASGRMGAATRSEGSADTRAGGVVSPAIGFHRRGLDDLGFPGPAFTRRSVSEQHLHTETVLRLLHRTDTLQSAPSVVAVFARRQINLGRDIDANTPRPHAFTHSGCKPSLRLAHALG